MNDVFVPWPALTYSSTTWRWFPRTACRERWPRTRYGRTCWPRPTASPTRTTPAPPCSLPSTSCTAPWRQSTGGHVWFLKNKWKYCNTPFYCNKIWIPITMKKHLLDKKLTILIYNSVYFTLCQNLVGLMNKLFRIHKLWFCIYKWDVKFLQYIST